MIGLHQNKVNRHFDALTKQAEKLLDRVSHKQELILRDKQMAAIPEPLRYVTEAFDSLLVLDLQDNNIQELDGDLCKNLPRL